MAKKCKKIMPKKQKEIKVEKENKTIENEAVAETVETKRILSTAPEQNHFFVADGTKLGSVLQLAEALETMHEDTYKFHANESKNDFSTWLQDIFGEQELAESLKTAGTKTEAQLAITKKLLKELLK